MVSAVKGCKFASLSYETPVKLKKDAPLSNVTRVVSYDSVMVGNINYENVVNAHKKKSPTADSTRFTADSLPWGVWELPNKVITHKGARYLRYYTYTAPTSTAYMVNGTPATPAEIVVIKQYEYAKSSGSAKQSAQGLADSEQVTPKVVTFGNIKSFKVNGDVYTASTATTAA